MSNLPGTPWHQVVSLRDDVRSGDLSLSAFAADLDDVAMARGRFRVYEDPAEFFALTYPTFNLRELARDVVRRLAGASDRAVRQLVLTYGGGKTHALITLYHLANDPERLPDLPAVAEFVEHIGMQPPKARIGVLAFDRLDPETGMDTRAPDGAIRRLRLPWSVLAWQLGGEEGLRMLGGADGERATPPFTNVLEELLQLPARDGEATLVLIDEVLMWARTMIDQDPAWRHRLQDFFQCLTQAAAKTPGCAVTVSLLASDPRKSDEAGKQVLAELSAVLRRQQEVPVEPVLKEDVAEVLRRRFFTPQSIRDRNRFAPHVVAAVRAIGGLDEQTQRDRLAAEERFAKSYPFHPDLTDVFYSKWTNLEAFQRARGILRTFAIALRDAERWDDGPLVGPGAFLGAPGEEGLSEATRELATIAETEEYEGRRQSWTGILEGELRKAREVQVDFPALQRREVEQAAMATFLHSQPIGHQATTRELMLLLGVSAPDRIELEKSLLRWAESSWFLDDAALNDAEVGPDGQKLLPRVWRLGARPNLRQMHHDACRRVSDEVVTARLVDEIGRQKSLTAGASAAGARVHTLPERPRDIEDDGDFHYAVLGLRAVSDAGRPSAEAKRLLLEKAGPDAARVYRNAVVLAVLSRDGLDVARSRIRDSLGWGLVEDSLKGSKGDLQQGALAANVAAAGKRVPDAVRQAYCIVVTVSRDDEVEAFRVAPGDGPLFAAIKEDPRSRIQETAISAEALLPEGPYGLWHDGETSRRVQDLVGAFAQLPRLPKMLNRQAIVETVAAGCREGQFVLRLPRPDGSARTFWRRQPEETALKDPALMLVLPESAELLELEADQLTPGVLPKLWDEGTIPVQRIQAYFGGGGVLTLPRDGYETSVSVPRAQTAVVEAAIREGVRTGRLWLRSGAASLLAEEVPEGLLTPDTVLEAPPPPAPATGLLPEALPDAWDGGVATVRSLHQALSSRAGKLLPWARVRAAVDDALRARLLEASADSAPWPCEPGGAASVRLREPVWDRVTPRTSPPQSPPDPNRLTGEADLRPDQIQDLAECVGELAKAAVGLELRLHLRVDVTGAARPAPETVDRLNDLLGEIDPDLRLA